MLRIIRTLLAIVMLAGATFLFVDFSASVHPWIGWIAKIQFIPAILALNFIVVAALLLATFLFGRVYCSVVCPLGILQDVIARLGRIGVKLPYRFSPALKWLRLTMLAIMIAAGALGAAAIVALLDPYSTFGRIVSSLIGPLWRMGNNELAAVAEANDSYAFAEVESQPVAWVVMIVAIASLFIIGTLAWRNGRTYCNTICPVGTVLGFLSRFSIFAPVIDTSKCISCGICARRCKASCIDSRNHVIDYSRCVACMDCIDNCEHDALHYTIRHRHQKTEPTPATAQQNGRRQFLTVTATMAVATAARAADKTVDGGLAVIADKKVPVRQTRIVPPGAESHANLASHCTACQLCIQVCPNGVLRPSTSLETLMQPESSYERGYCRPECNKCSQVCPAGAIKPIPVEEKVSTQIGHAVWVKDNCVVLTDGVSCGNCARHCPTGAITMVRLEKDNPDSPLVPAVDTERCIGCGACENLCPSRPFSAIYVEGHERHRTL